MLALTCGVLSFIVIILLVALVGTVVDWSGSGQRLTDAKAETQEVTRELENCKRDLLEARGELDKRMQTITKLLSTNAKLEERLRTARMSMDVDIV